MKYISLLLLLVLTFAGALVAGRSSAEPSESVRYIDMQKCLTGYRAGQAEMETFNEISRSRESALMAQRSELQNRGSELEILDPASVEFREGKAKINDDIAQFQRDVKRFQEEQQLEILQVQARAFKQIFEAARIVGEQNGFSAVMRSPGTLPTVDAEPRALLDYFDFTQLLWTNPNYDVSELVLKVLNGEG
jgi:Skp family chaperone for outer membrane proteins